MAGGQRKLLSETIFETVFILFYLPLNIRLSPFRRQSYTFFPKYANKKVSILFSKHYEISFFVS